MHIHPKSCYIEPKILESIKLNAPSDIRVLSFRGRGGELDAHFKCAEQT